MSDDRPRGEESNSEAAGQEPRDTGPAGSGPWIADDDDPPLVAWFIPPPRPALPDLGPIMEAVYEGAAAGDLEVLESAVQALEVIGFDQSTTGAIRFLKQIRSLRKTLGGKGGRPRGSRKGQSWTRRPCLEWWVSWTELDGSPTREKLAVAMGLSKTNPEEAVRRWRSTGLQWPPTEEELEELLDEEDE